ncbi:translation initiation factor SUI1, putative [Plasmodium sp. DRC-Itaito]|nr:translation initiation factor SUI1, putative [Plasmodium sp. DRC-Itaito]
MFKNKVTLVNKNLLGSKDRKKLAITLKSTFYIEKEEDIDEILDKEDTTFCKVQKTKIVIYFSKNIPVLFSINNVIYPTVYTLWKFPKMIPCFVIYPPASEFLLRGADLMIPGICKEIDNTDKMKEGCIWGVRVFNNPYLFAVGDCAIEYNNNKMFYDLKGKCLKLVHIFNDEIWKLGPQNVPHNSFKIKLIDSVEEVVDDFYSFRIYKEDKGKKTNTNVKAKQNKEKEQNKKNNNEFGWGSDNDNNNNNNDEKTLNNSEGKCNDMNDTSTNKDESNKGNNKSVSNVRYLENFYKHFNVILDINNNKNKKVTSSSLHSNNNTEKVENKINNAQGDQEINKTNILSDKQINEKKECQTDINGIEKNLNSNECNEILEQDDIINCKHDNNNLNYEKNILPINEHNEEIKEDNIKENEINDNNINDNKKNFELNTQQQDLLLSYLLLESLYTIPDENLPMEVSGIYSKMTKECVYIHLNKKFLEELNNMNNISIDIIDQIKKNIIHLDMDVKKSSYKKLMKFIQHYSKMKLLKIKENRNIISIVNIERQHALYKSYEPINVELKKKYDIENEQTNLNINENKNKINKTPINNSTNKGAQVLEFYMPSNKTLNIIQSIENKVDKSAYFNINQLKDILKSYIKLNKLQCKENNNNSNNLKGYVILNEELKNIMNVQESSNMVPYETILNQFISLQQPCYAIIKPNANFDIDPIKITKGVCPSIHIYSVARMKGKKYVTHITNLYLFHLDLNKFSEHLQKQLACSCSIVISPSTKKEEVLVQGNVVNQIYNILINNYNLPRKYIVLNTKG